MLTRTTMTLTLSALLAVSSAYGQAQAQRALSGNIPFEFTLGLVNKLPTAQ